MKLILSVNKQCKNKQSQPAHSWGSQRAHNWLTSSKAVHKVSISPATPAGMGTASSRVRFAEAQATTPASHEETAFIKTHEACTPKIPRGGPQEVRG